MKIILRILPAMIILLFSADTVKSSFHFQGAHLTYSCVGGNEYEIKLRKFINHCHLPGPNSVNYEHVNPCTGDTTTHTLTQTDAYTQNIPCESQCAPCGSGLCSSDQTIYTYKDTIIMDSSICCNSTLSYTRSGGRGGSGFQQVDFYIEADMDICQKPCHDGVKFNDTISPYLHKNAPVSINYGLQNPAGDTLIYALDNPMNGPGDPYTYTSPMSAQYPLPVEDGPAGFDFDSLTGTMSFTPDQEYFKAPVVVRADQYHNGEIYSTVRQEIMFIVNDYNNNVPAITGGDGVTDDDVIWFCEGDSNCFTIYSNDQDINDSVFLSWQTNLPPSADISVSDDQQQSMQLCWEPSAAGQQEAPYYLLVKAQDDGCIMAGENRKLFWINVTDIKMIPEVSHTISCNHVNLSADLTEDSIHYDYAWTYDGDTLSDHSHAELYFPQAGSYPVTFKGILDKGCHVFEIHDTIEILNDSLQVQASPDTSICRGDSALLYSQVEGGAAPFSFSWAEGPESEQYSVSPDSTTDYHLSVTDNRGCQKQDTVTVTVNSLPVFQEPESTEICINDDGITLHSNNNGIWDGPGLAGNKFHPDITGPGTYTLTYEETNQYGCHIKDSVSIQVFDIPVVDGGQDPDLLCTGDTLLLEGIPDGGSWQGNGVRLNSDSDYIFDAADAGPGNHPLYYYYTDANGCTNTDTIIAEVQGSPEYTLPADTAVCVDSPPIQLEPEPAVNGEWSGTTISPGGEFDPAQADTGIHTLVFNDPQTPCFIPDTMFISIYVIPEISFSVEPDSGEAPLDVTFTGQSNTDIASWEWVISSLHDTINLQGAVVQHTFEDSGIYAAELTALADTAGCRAVLQQEEALLVTPEEDEVNIITMDQAADNWKVFPNPAEDGFTLMGDQGKLKKVSIYTIDGRKIESHPADGKELYVPRDNAPAGPVLILAELEDGSRFFKRVIFSSANPE